MPVMAWRSRTQCDACATSEACTGGASDCVANPARRAKRGVSITVLVRELLPELRMLGCLDHLPGEKGAARVIAAGEGAMSRTARAAARPHVVVIGVSTGGPEALEILLPELPGNFPLPVLVVQHMPEVFTQPLAERLDSRCLLRVKEVQDGELLVAGTVHVARGNWHMEVLAGARAGAPCSLHLTQGPPENHCRPAVDVVLRSAVQAFGAGVLAVQLTGMGADGLTGCRAVRAAGGVVLAQDEATSVVWGMPGAVVHAGLAHRVLPIEAMAREILRLTNWLDTETAPGREKVVQS